MTNCYIINYNRLSSPKAMVEYLRQIPEINPIIMDNGSSYQPLLDWYATKPCEVVRHELNWGETIMWMPDLNYIDYYNLKAGNYIVTDPDLDLSLVKTDFLSKFQEGLNRFPWADKCGTALRVDNLPESPLKESIILHEQANWREPLGDDYYKAALDTTTALYKSSIHSFECVRVGGEYQAKHIDWYYTDYKDLPDDYKYYLNSITQAHSHWSKEIKRRAEL